MFSHPYEPYGVQEQFMSSLYDTLQNKKIGIFESPTGTGKTLSLICPALAWLRDAEQRILDSDLASLDSSKMPQWAVKSARELKLASHRQRGEKLHELIREARKTLDRETTTKLQDTKRRFNIELTSQSASKAKRQRVSDALDPSHFLPVENEDEEMLKLIGSVEDDEDLKPLVPPVRIFYASRTHSQLQQLAETLRLLKVPASWSTEAHEPVRYIPLGSRKQLCINPEVLKLSSAQQMNERCSELGNQCEFREKTTPLQNRALAQIMDIEDLGVLGRSIGNCPYYASRQAARYAEVVTLPYQLLLQRRTRAALGIDLSNSVVIIDEAHNLMDTISGLFSSSCTQIEAQNALKGLHLYYARVGPRLSARNAARVRELTVVLKGLCEFFVTTKPGAPGTELRASNLFRGQADAVDILSLVQFISESKLAFKVDSYLLAVAASETQATSETRKSQRRVVLSSVMDFMAVAGDPLAAGKLFWDRMDTGEPCIKYLLLDTSHSFRDVVDEAHCVILAGGTMEPTSDFTSHLFPYLDSSQISIFSCGHIVPRESLLVEVVARRGQQEFQFNYARREDISMLQDLGKTILELARKVPYGLVVFFPGYKYLASILDAWNKSGVYSTLDAVKRIFRESESNSTETLFSKYKKHIDGGKGACLLAVVGGKLSEGINFSDNLARGVVMVGLPFPNAFSAEMVAKRQNIEATALKNGSSGLDAKDKARQYYENLAMRAVNQSVGRAIRHRNDYAAIYLIDQRYMRPEIQSKLSKWVRNSLQQSDDWQSDTESFFSSHK